MDNNKKKKEKEKEKVAPAAAAATSATADAMAAADAARPPPLCWKSEAGATPQGEELTQGGGGRGRTAEEQDEQGAYGELPHQGGHTR